MRGTSGVRKFGGQRAYVPRAVRDAQASKNLRRAFRQSGDAKAASAHFDARFERLINNADSVAIGANASVGAATAAAGGGGSPRAPSAQPAPNRFSGASSVARARGDEAHASRVASDAADMSRARALAERARERKTVQARTKRGQPLLNMRMKHILKKITRE